MAVGAGTASPLEAHGDAKDGDDDGVGALAEGGYICFPNIWKQRKKMMYFSQYSVVQHDSKWQRCTCIVGQLGY